MIRSRCPMGRKLPLMGKRVRTRESEDTLISEDNVTLGQKSGHVNIDIGAIIERVKRLTCIARTFYSQIATKQDGYIS